MRNPGFTNFRSEVVFRRHVATRLPKNNFSSNISYDRRGLVEVVEPRLVLRRGNSNEQGSVSRMRECVNEFPEGEQLAFARVFLGAVLAQARR